MYRIIKFLPSLPPPLEVNCDLLCWELRLPSFHFFSLSFSVSCHGGQNSEIIKQKRNDPKERETRPDYVSKHHLPNQAEIVIFKLEFSVWDREFGLIRHFVVNFQIQSCVKTLLQSSENHPTIVLMPSAHPKDELVLHNISASHSWNLARKFLHYIGYRIL